MKKSEQKINAYQMLLFEDEALTPEKRLWKALLNLEEGHDKLRKSLFHKVSELEKENKGLKEMLWNLKSKLLQEDMFSDILQVAK